MTPSEVAAREFFGCESLGVHPEIANEDGTEGAPVYVHRCGGKCESLATLLSQAAEGARGEERERCAKFLRDRIDRLNVLGCDADQPLPGATLGLLQAERRLEAQHIEAALRSAPSDGNEGCDPSSRDNASRPSVAAATEGEKVTGNVEADPRGGSLPLPQAKCEAVGMGSTPTASTNTPSGGRDEALEEAERLLWAIVDPAYPGTSGLTIGEWDKKAKGLVNKIRALKKGGA